MIQELRALAAQQSLDGRVRQNLVEAAAFIERGSDPRQRRDAVFLGN
jgi:hypothetical protein